MKIVHICLACFYVEGMGYQENILPKWHAKEHQTTVITSTYAFDKAGNITEKTEYDYYNTDNVRVLVLEKNKNIFGKYGDFKGIKATLKSLNPDIIFVHGGQFIGLRNVIQYCKKNHHVKLYLDNHADYYNTPIDTKKRLFLQRYLYGYYIRKAEKWCVKMWGVTPWRCQYLKDVYNIDENKIDLLVMGGEDEKIHLKEKKDISLRIRKQLDIKMDDFVIITGGKIDKVKNIHLLMKVMKNLNPEIKLIVFGEPTVEMKDEIMELAIDSHIRYIGWLDANEVYDYFLASDLAVFPGTHSVLWEQACACGIPCVFKNWEGMHHVDLGGNCFFLEEDNENNLAKVIYDIYIDKDKYNSMLKVSSDRCVKYFSYKNISKLAIGLSNDNIIK